MAQNVQTRNLSRRAFLQGAASVMSVAALAACAPTVQPTTTTESNEAAAPAAMEETTVLWWYAHGGALGELMERLAADFSAANESVAIQPEYQGGYEELMNKLIVSAAASTLPDLIHVGDGQYPPLARADILLPLDDLVNGPDGLDMADYFSPIERGRLDGTLYQIAYGVSTPIFYYNAEALESVGLSGAPETWDDFYNVYLPALADSGMTGFAYGPGSWWQQSAYWSNGVMVNDDNWEIDLANAKVAAWFTQMQEARRNEQVIYPVQADQNANGLFGAGRAAMAINSTGSIGSIDELNGGKFTAEVGYLPAGDAGRFVPSGGNGLSISNNASDGNRDAAWSFIKYLHDPTQYAEYDILSGYIPLTQSTTDAMADVLDAEPRRRVAIEQFEFSRWHMKSHTVARANNELQAAWNEAVSLDIDVQERLDQLQATIAEILTEEGFEPVLPA